MNLQSNNLFIMSLLIIFFIIYRLHYLSKKLRISLQNYRVINEFGFFTIFLLCYY